jgi:hypothetical protein
MIGFHPFSEKTKALFIYNYNCFECGRSDKGLTPHHNVSQWKINEYTDSPINLIPLCINCHENVKQDKEETERYCLQTMRYLKSEGYVPTIKDINYLVRYKLEHLIEKII